MANITVSTTSNFDDSANSALANGDDITIQLGAVLTVNSDVRWSQNAAVIGNITISAISGGTCRLDGRDVWWIPFDASTGNVPSLGTAGTPDVTRSGSNVGEFLGVWTALGVAPAAAGGAMPASGFIKLRTKSTTLADNDVLTFANGATITINSTTGGQRGWLSIIGEEQQVITVPRLGKWEAFGDWFELGTTNGTDDQTFQYFIDDVCPAIQVETGAGSGIYEWWLNAGTTRWGQVANRVAQDARGKFFGCTTGGVITIARRATNACGYKPPTGCKVRVPNIHVGCSTSTDWTLNTQSATIGNRWEFVTTSAGAIEMEKIAGTWYLNFSQAYSISLTDCAALDQIVVAECATRALLTRTVVSLTASIDNSPFSVTSCFAGITLTDCQCIRYECELGDIGASFSNCLGVILDGCTFMTFGDNTAATLTRGGGNTSACVLTRVADSEVTDCAFAGAGLRMVECANIIITNLIYGDSVEGRTTSNSTAVPAVDITGACSDITVDGYGGNWLTIANTHPYNAIVSVAQSKRVEVKNIATVASPYDCGSSNACAGIFASGGNNANCIVRRCYCQNARTAAVVDMNSDSRMSYVNAWGDGADIITINSLNLTVAQGLRGTTPMTGATAVYGSHFYDLFPSTTEGRLMFLCNEPTLTSASKCAATGTPNFTSTGTVQLDLKDNAVTWTMDYNVLGWTSFATTEPVVAGTETLTATFEYQIDTGSGFSAWKNLVSPRYGCTGTSGTAIINVNSTTGLAVNDYVYGTGVGTGARIQTIDSATQITVTVNNSGTVSGTLRFNQLPNESITASGGFRLKMRATQNHQWRFPYDTEGGGGTAFSVGETITWTGGSGTLARLIDLGTTGDLYLDNVAGSIPADNATVTGATSGRTALVNGTIGRPTLINIRVTGVTNSTDYAIQYPLPGTQLTLTGLVAGSDVVILAAGTSTIRAQADAVPGTTYTYEYTSTETVDIGIIKTGCIPLYIRNYPLAASDVSLPVAQQTDRNYAA